jgi:hypothetical protein
MVASSFVIFIDLLIPVPQLVDAIWNIEILKPVDVFIESRIVEFLMPYIYSTIFFID